MHVARLRWYDFSTAVALFYGCSNFLTGGVLSAESAGYEPKEVSLKRNDFLEHADCKLVGHARHIFYDAFLIALPVSDVEHLLCRVVKNILLVRFPFRNIVCVFYEPVFKRFAQSGVVAECKRSAAVERVGLCLHERAVDAAQNVGGILLEFDEAPVVVYVCKIESL
jgi:hypothetical protein